MITTVVFDLFSTLIHAEGKRTYLKLFTKLGLTPEEMWEARRICMVDNFDTLAGLAEHLVPGSSIDSSRYDEEVELEIDGAELYPETLHILHRLRQEGYMIGMISNLASPYKRAFFDFDLHKKIDTYVFSCDVGFVKPEPEIYRVLLGRMGVQPDEVLMTGDKERQDVLGPRGVGMNAVLLDRSGEAPNSIQSLEGVFEHL